jgi:hypothetical protein
MILLHVILYMQSVEDCNAVRSTIIMNALLADGTATYICDACCMYSVVSCITYQTIFIRSILADEISSLFLKYVYLISFVQVISNTSNINNNHNDRRQRYNYNKCKRVNNDLIIKIILCTTYYNNIFFIIIQLSYTSIEY